MPRATADLQDELLSAVSEEDFETARLAAECGADVNGTARNPPGTALFWAVALGTETDEAACRRVRWMLAAGARVETAPPTYWGTSVHEAAERGYVETLKVLLSAGGGRTLELFDDQSRTPLICAASE